MTWLAMVESSVTMSTMALDWDWNVCWKLRYLALRTYISTLGPRQNGRYFPDDIFKLIFLNETVSISIKISLKFVPMGPINNIPALVQIMAWRWPGDKPLSEWMMVTLLTHICFTRPQWVRCCQVSCESTYVKFTHLRTYWKSKTLKKM